MEPTLLSIFWFSSAVLVLLFHEFLFRVPRMFTFPDRIKALYMFGKIKSSLESKTTLPVPKRWFSHFYAVGLMVHSIFFIYFFQLMLYPEYLSTQLWLFDFLIYPAADLEERNFLPIFLLLVAEWFQLARRLYECWFISSFSKGTMSIFHYFYGLFIYSTFGIGLVSSVKISKITSHFCAWYDIACLIPAAIIFVVASYYQHQTFKRLATLRKVEKGKTTKGHYIPKGGLFEYMSCPHYFCEIMIYLSFTLAFQFRNIHLNALFSFVTTNQISCALMTHEWYIENFKHYPKKRNAIFPPLFS